MRGVYLPYWTFDARADAAWTAEAGHYYYVEVRGKRERRVRWTPASGSLSHVFDDELVCASLGVEPGLLRAVEPFPTDTLVPYDPGYLAGWVVERYQIDLVAAAERSRRQMDARLRELCAREVPGDTHRNLQVRASYRGQTFKHVLVPVWLLTYTFGSRSFQVVANGQTGRIGGEYPKSVCLLDLVIPRRARRAVMLPASYAIACRGAIGQKYACAFAANRAVGQVFTRAARRILRGRPSPGRCPPEEPA